MSDEPTTIKLPAGLAKYAGLLMAALAGGGGGTLLQNERMAKLETKVEMLQAQANDQRGWLTWHNEELREAKKP